MKYQIFRVEILRDKATRRALQPVPKVADLGYLSNAQESPLGHTASLFHSLPLPALMPGLHAQACL